MPKIFTASIKIPISDENVGLIPIWAKGFWYHPEMEMTPEKIIEDHTKRKFDELINTFLNAITLHFWQANIEQVQAISELLRSKVEIEAKFEGIIE